MIKHLKIEKQVFCKQQKNASRQYIEDYSSFSVRLVICMETASENVGTSDFYVLLLRLALNA